MQKCEFRDEFFTLFRRIYGSSIAVVVVAGDFNAWVERISPSKGFLAGHCTLPTHCTGDENKPL